MSTVQTVVKNSSVTARMLADDIRDYVRGRRRDTPALDARQAKALDDLRRDGYAVVPDYWPRERAFEVRDKLEGELRHGGDHDYPSGAYLRFQDDNVTDQGVRRLYHVEREFPELADARTDPWVLAIAEAYYGVPFNSGLLMFQHNLASNHETRSYHVDGFAREFKSFIYLDDVTEGNGPFTYLRGSHRRHLLRLRKQLVGNEDAPDTSFFESDLAAGDMDDEILLQGQAGTLILTDVRGLHRGSPQRDGSRSVLVNYIVKHPGDLELGR